MLRAATHPYVMSETLLYEAKGMVLKHAPLGEINLPFVASNAIIPRCRRNRCSFRIGPVREGACGPRGKV